MSIAQKIRGLLGQKLLANTAGFRVVRPSGKTGPWVNEGELLALIPVGLREVQFPVDVMASDNILAQVQISVIFTYTDQAEQFFNFAYDVADGKHTGDAGDTVKKALMNALAPKVVAESGNKEIAAMVKETTLVLEHPESLCNGIDIKSIQLSVKPRDANVMANLGAQKTEELLRAANTARQETRMQTVTQTAELRVAEHAEALNSAGEAEALIAEQAKNRLAEARSTVAAETELASQKAEDAKAMVAAFNNDPMAYALYELSRSGGNVTITTDFLAAIRSKAV